MGQSVDGIGYGHLEIFDSKRLDMIVENSLFAALAFQLGRIDVGADNNGEIPLHPFDNGDESAVFLQEEGMQHEHIHPLFLKGEKRFL